MNGITVFSGQNHRALAAEICACLGAPLSPATFRRFSNDCQYVQLNSNCRERDVFIIQPIAPPVPDTLVDLLLMLDAARGASAKRVTAVIPHYAYARSDKKDAPRISIAGRLVADLMVTAGANRVLAMTLHSEQVDGFFSVPVDHLNALDVLAEHFRTRDLGPAVVVSPDLGNAKTAGDFARTLGLPVAAGRKQRIGDAEVVIDMIVGDVRDRHAIVMDDEIATGSSIIEVITKLREQGATGFSIACTHGIFARDSLERLSQIEGLHEIVVTNTVPIPTEKRTDKLVELSIAPLMAEAIRRIHMGESVSSLFQK